jgi:hypothetical protein
VKTGRGALFLPSLEIAMTLDPKGSAPTHSPPITKTCRNATSSRTLSRHENHRDEANMPFLFWMPMIVMCGLWRAAAEDTQAPFRSER